MICALNGVWSASPGSISSPRSSGTAVYALIGLAGLHRAMVWNEIIPGEGTATIENARVVKTTSRGKTCHSCHRHGDIPGNKK